MAEGRKLSETRLLLIGKTGSGKSSTGNSILGEKVFRTSLSFASSTTSSSYEERIREDRRLVVVDTPGFYDTVKTNTEIVREISKVFGYLSSGFHAMLYVLNTERFTQESMKTKKLFFRTFGEDVKKYTIIVLTHYDRVKEEGITDIGDYLKTAGPEFTTFYKACNKRLVAFNNKATGREMDGQVTELLHMVDRLNKDNYGNAYTNFHLKLVHAFTKIERRRRRDLRKTRETLFSQAVKHLGMERMVTWDMEQDRPIRLKALEDQASFQAAVVPTTSMAKRTNKIKAIPIKPGQRLGIALADKTTKTGTSLIKQQAGKLEPESANSASCKEVTCPTTCEEISGDIAGEVRGGAEQFNLHEEHSKSRGNTGNKHAEDLGDTFAERVCDKLTIQDIEQEADVSNWHDEVEEDVVEQRKAMKDENFVKRLVDFFCVFFEKLVK